jgi:hypothetical protein
MTKTSLGNVESLFNANSPFCIEISLRTPENQTMVLETWCVSFNDQLVDPTQKVCFNVYKKMSLVLRSLMCITRSTPTYQLSRRQSSDTYVLLYRMYCGEPIVHHLGENYATSKVGTVGTPIGSIVVNLAYRTRLTMTPQTSSHLNEYTGGIQIKDDHFTEGRPRSQTDSPYTFSSNSRYSSCDVINNSPNSPPIITDNRQSPRTGGLNMYDQFSSMSSVSKRSSSNLNTIAEQPFHLDQARAAITTNINRTTSKTQPIPMKLAAQQQGNKMNNNLQLQPRNSNDYNQIMNDESSADENNSSSVASTPDTIYYFKLKSAAFVPSASFTNNYSTSFGNISNENNASDLPPFITLLSADLSNLSTNDRHQHQQQQLAIDYNQMAQSPPPPQTLIEYPPKTTFSKQAKSRNNSSNNTMILNLTNNEHMASPCSLPNFKMLDTYNQQFLNHTSNSNNTNNSASNQTDDFVFVDSVKFFILIFTLKDIFLLFQKFNSNF